MTPRLYLASLLLVATPCVFAQTATPPPANADGPPHAHAARGKADDRGGRPGPGGEMPGGPGGGPTARLLPPGTWWRDSAVAGRIGLTADQQKRIDEIFLQSRMQLVQMHATLESEELQLEPLLNANPVDQAKALAHIGKIADTRADLEKANAKMLLGIRGVLNADQWTKLQAEHHGPPRGGEGGPARGGPEGRGGRGPGGQQGPPPPRE